jgi:hypothetical protein
VLDEARYWDDETTRCVKLTAPGEAVTEQDELVVETRRKP